MNTVALGTGEPSSLKTRPVKSGRAPGAAKAVKAKSVRPTRTETFIQVNLENRGYVGLDFLERGWRPAGAGESPALPFLNGNPTPVFTFMATPLVANPCLLFQRALQG